MKMKVILKITCDRDMDPMEVESLQISMFMKVFMIPKMKMIASNMTPFFTPTSPM